jgi:hypothetical protein
MAIGRQLIFILWPSFVIAGIAEGIFFTAFDPMDLRLFDAPIEASRTAVYSLGFFAFWLLAAASSALTCFFQRTSSEVNRRTESGASGSRSGREGGRPAH